MSEDLEKRIREADKVMLKAAMKEAMHEWLEEKFAAFGWWSFKGLLAAALAGCLYLIVLAQIHK